MSEKPPSPDGRGPSAGESWRNFWESDMPMAKRIRVAMRNNMIKMRTRKQCCGNYGEPGC